jgi:hypothetical protein
MENVSSKVMPSRHLAGADREESVPDPNRSNPMRRSFGVLLFVAWSIETILWVASTVHSVLNGHVTPAITAASAIALLVVLGMMEGLEVSVIDRWQALWPGKPTSYLAGWLAARQLFVALIVTAATLLANRPAIIVPGTSVHITNAFVLSVFDLTWTGFTVLWFAQICPKHMGAKNPDRYLACLRRPLFPVVSFVHRVGISQPGEWTADAVEHSLNWSLSAAEAKSRRPGPEQSLAAIWREL